MKRTTAKYLRTTGLVLGAVLWLAGAAEARPACGRPAQASAGDTSGLVSPMEYPGYHLVWHDEFNGKRLDTASWNYEKGGHGWGNHELEYYTARKQNVFLKKGMLVIQARKEAYGGNAYTSARITTQGKREFQYGRVDIRARLPVAKGMWPALWMLGRNIGSVSWPACGEIDIMEVIGKNPSQVVGSLHWKKADGREGTFNNRYDLAAGDFSTHFHVFSLIWEQDSIQILVDNIPYVKASRRELSDGDYPFSQPFFFIFNVAVGGDWPGISRPYHRLSPTDVCRLRTRIW